MVDAVLRPTAGHPFDALADDYDRSFVETRLGRWLRSAVWDVLAENFSRGDRILELGSATGEDAVWLAGRGVEVTGTDASAKMLAVARRKSERAAVAQRVVFHQIDWNAPDASVPAPRPYDGMLANFGVLNCIRDRRALAERLAVALRPGARAVVVMMGPMCAWEIAWRLGHGDVRGAFRRLRTDATARLMDGETFPVWYPSATQLAEEFGPRLQRRAVSGLGFLLPPTDLCHLVERWPRAFARLRGLDARCARRAISSRLADHYVAVFERV
jgi:2-polyprenyl-3-methyl-5-hydroxy-6-metoxy-1,4-benzoquinol methylase